MYDTLVNLQSGPRVLGETFELRALPGNKHPGRYLTAFGSGFGGDPNSFTKLDLSKGKITNSLALPPRPPVLRLRSAGQPEYPPASIPIRARPRPLRWPQVNQSPFLFNTVRRMTDTSLTMLPLSKVTYRSHTRRTSSRAEPHPERKRHRQ